MQVNVTDNSPNNNNNSRKEEFKYDCDTTPCFPVFILNNLGKVSHHFFFFFIYFFLLTFFYLLCTL